MHWGPGPRGPGMPPQPPCPGAQNQGDSPLQGAELWLWSEASSETGYLHGMAPRPGEARPGSGALRCPAAWPHPVTGSACGLAPSFLKKQTEESPDWSQRLEATPREEAGLSEGRQPHKPPQNPAEPRPTHPPTATAGRGWCEGRPSGTKPHTGRSDSQSGKAPPRGSGVFPEPGPPGHL